MYSFPILNQFIVPWQGFQSSSIASWPAYKFLRIQARWSSIPISLRMFHCLLWSTQSGLSIVNEAEVDVFLELSCFFYDPMDVVSLISGSSAFSKSSLNIWKLSVESLAWRILSMTLLACEMSTEVQYEHSLALPFFGIGMKFFSRPMSIAEFSKLAGILREAL